MKFHDHPAPPGQPASQLWLMLPGAYMKPSDFIEAGFVDAVRRRNLPHDISLLEANIAEVADGSALSLLQQTLRAEAADRGRRVCLLGISLGAHLALACLARASRGPAEAAAAEQVAAACLLAPYLGPRQIAAEVAAAGALHRWQPAVPPHNDMPDDDIDLAIWQWLQRQPAGESRLYLGYGRDDRFAKGHALMAEALPAGQVDIEAGGHVWPVWTVLWNRHLERVYVQR